MELHRASGSSRSFLEVTVIKPGTYSQYERAVLEFLLFADVRQLDLSSFGSVDGAFTGARAEELRKASLDFEPELG